MYKAGLIALALLISGGAQAAANLGAKQKAAVIRQLDRRVEKGNWKVQLSGSPTAKTRSFTANDMHVRTSPPRIAVGHLVRGRFDTRTQRITLQRNLEPK
jgi:hypothetical protein